MAGTDSSDFTAGASQHSYFVPMVDMLAGVVFLLIIMLASSVLVTRQDFSQAEQMEKEIARISAELEAARTNEQLYLEPRRRAKAALNELLTRVVASLRKSGVAATADPETGRITVAGDLIPFAGAGSKISENGQQIAQALTRALQDEVPCLAANQPGGPDCARYNGVKLETVLLAAPSSVAQVSEALSKARALALLSEMTAQSPGLLELKAEDGADLLAYGVQPGTTSGATGAVELLFQMALPPIR